MASAVFSAITPFLCVFLSGLVASVLMSGNVRGVGRNQFLSVNNSLFQIITLSTSQKRFSMNPEIKRGFYSPQFAISTSPGLSELTALAAFAGGFAALKTNS